MTSIRPSIAHLQQALAGGDAPALEAAIHTLVHEAQSTPLSIEDATPLFAALAPELPSAMVEPAIRLVPYLVTPHLFENETARGLIGFGLVHPNQSVQLAVLEALTVLLDDKSTQAMHEALLSSVVALAAGESVNVWIAAAKLLRKAAAREATVLHYLFTAETTAAMSGNNATQVLRALELYARLATDSEAGFSLAESGGQLKRVLGAWRQSEVLVRLNALEIIGELCGSQRGFQWVEQEGVIAELLATMAQTDSLDAALLVPSILKAVAKIVHTTPDSCPVLLEGGTLPTALAQMAEGDNSDGELALSVLGMVAGGAGGLDALCQTLNLSALLADKLRSTQLQRVASMLCISNMLRSTSEKLEQTVCEINEAVTANVGHSMVAVLVRQSAQPVEELQVAALTALAGLAENQWGVQMIVREGGAAESILNRGHPNQCKEAKEWRFAVVRQMLQFREALGSAELVSSLVQYEIAGPFVASSTN